MTTNWGWKGQIESPGSYVDMPSYILLNGGNLIITFPKATKKTRHQLLPQFTHFFSLEKSGAFNFWGGTISNVPNVTTRFLQHKISSKPIDASRSLDEFYPCRVWFSVLQSVVIVYWPRPFHVLLWHVFEDVLWESVGTEQGGLAKIVMT